MSILIGKVLKACFGSLFVAAMTIGAALSSSAAGADQYRAFYYDSEGRLLQVEEVPDGELRTRKLVSIDESLMVVPMLTGKDVPLISGENIPMSRFAVLAVYYTYDEAAQSPREVPSDVQARPDKVEYLGFVKERMLGVCAKRGSTAPCIFPKRCHCMTTTCCCY